VLSVHRRPYASCAKHHVGQQYKQQTYRPPCGGDPPAQATSRRQRTSRPTLERRITFLREMYGRLKLSWLSSVMRVWQRGSVRTGWFRYPILYARSAPCATPLVRNGARVNKVSETLHGERERYGPVASAERQRSQGLIRMRPERSALRFTPYNSRGCAAEM
jgi:hypothetical protein